jgi:hypothetical protein
MLSPTDLTAFKDIGNYINYIVQIVTSKSLDLIELHRIRMNKTGFNGSARSQLSQVKYWLTMCG